MPLADPRLKSMLLMIFSNYEAPSRVLLYLVVLGNYSIIHHFIIAMNTVITILTIKIVGQKDGGKLRGAR